MRDDNGDVSMSYWLNTKKIIIKNIEKPCHKLGYCPYGQLVEEFPLHKKAEKYAIKHNKFVKTIKGKGWVSCSKNDKGATPDLNWACKKVKEPFSCKTFGHDCPVFYHAENIVE